MDFYLKNSTQIISNKIEILDFSAVFDSKDTSKITQAQRLLRRVHKDVYCQFFPLENEQESVDCWLDLLRLGSVKGQHVYMVFGRDLYSSDPEIMAFIAASITGSSSCGLIEYIIRKKEYSDCLNGLNICHLMVNRLQELNLLINHEPLKAVLWEVNDPEKTPYDEQHPDPSIDCMSPQKRRLLLEQKYRAKRIGIDYVQGPLRPCQTAEEINRMSCENLLLYLYDAANFPHFRAEDLYQYICCFNQITNEHKNPFDLRHTGINKMMNQILLMIDQNIPVLAERQTPEQIKKLKSCSGV